MASNLDKFLIRAIVIVALAWSAAGQPLRAQAPAVRTPRPSKSERERAAAAAKSPEAIAAQYRAAIEAGQQAVKDKDFKKASTHFQAAARLAPKNSEPLRLMAYAWLADDKHSAARQDALRALALETTAPANLQLAKTVARACLQPSRGKSGSYVALAYELLDAVRKVTPNDPELNQLLLRYHSAKGQPAEAAQAGDRWLRALRPAVEKDAAKFTPEVQADVVLIAHAYAQAGNTDKALAQLENQGAKAGNPIDTTLTAELHKQRVQSLMLEGEKLEKQKNFAEARQRYQQAAALDPQSGLPWQRIATTYEREGNWAEAQTAAVKAFELTPDERSRDLVLGHVRQQVRKKDYAAAIALMQPLRERLPGDLAVLDQLLLCYYETKDFAAATQAGEAGLAQYFKEYAENPKKKPYERYFIIYLARAYYQTGKLGPAIENQQAALIGPDGAPRDPSPAEQIVLERFLTEMGEGLMRDDKPDQAIAFLTAVSKISPRNADSHRQVARALRKKTGPAAAAEYLKGCVEGGRFADDRHIYEDLASYLFEEQKYAEAEAVYRQLSELRPDVKNYYADQIIECLKRQKKLKEAAAMVEEAILRIELSKMEERQKQWAISRLEDKNADLLDMTGVLQKRAAQALDRIARQPENPAYRDDLGGMYLDQGQVSLALSEHLAAAYLSGNPERLIRAGKEFASRREMREALIYHEAVLEHFPEYPKIFEVMDSELTLRRNRDFGRFAFNAELVEGHYVVEEACKRIIASNAPLEMKLEAEKRRIAYHYEVLPNDERHWRLQREDWAALLAKSEYPADFRNHCRERIIEIDTTKLGDLADACAMLEELAREQPSGRNMARLAELAIKLDAPPAPDVLRDYVGRNAADHEARMWLVAWLLRLAEPATPVNAADLSSSPDSALRAEARTLLSQTPENVRKDWADRGFAWALQTGLSAD